MAMDKKKIAKISLWVVAGLLVAFLLYFFFGKKKAVGETCPDGVTPIPPGGKCPQAKAPGTSGYVPPKVFPGGCVQPSSYGAVTFPMGLGMSGPQVAQFQTWLNAQGASLAVDSYFGCNTVAASAKYAGGNTLSQADFTNKVVAGGSAGQYQCNSQGQCQDSTGALVDISLCGGSCSPNGPTGVGPYSCNSSSQCIDSTGLVVDMSNCGSCSGT